ncbi:MAG: helix-turn-helix domain-containing protein [Chitinophagaceae bacterium]|nr:helix-turn-helix domain-containing protein [Chitinophagaceae bacterium]
MQTIEHNELFDLAFRFVTETSENIFLTGKAGTGKTTFLKYLKANSTKKVLVAAPTGVAAINAGGVTLHSLFQLPLHPFLPTSNNKKELLAKIRYGKQKQDILRKIELLVIDEISMVRCDVIDAIDSILKSIRRVHHSPFGGVQVLYIGDLHQLPPVAQNQEWNILSEYYNSPFFFDSHAIKEQAPLLIELTKIYRQKEENFVALLNKVRNNNMDPLDFDELHRRFIPGFRPGPDENYITLTSHNNQADLINQQQLYKLTSPAFTYKAIIEGDFPDNLFPVEGDLVLKEGAQVMFLKNDPVQKRYFNGKIGVVASLEKDKISVDCDGTIIDVQQEIWENARYKLNRADGKLEQEMLGSFKQYPLRLAWAITIHKSQGLTFEKVMIDAAAAFSSGQVYVALSRCTSLDGIVLLSKIPTSAIYSNSSIVKGQQFLAQGGSLAERFSGARQAFTQQLLEEIFSFGETELAFDQLFSSINVQQDKLNEEALAWIKNLKAGFVSDKAVGSKFITQVAELMRIDPVIENNQPLQKRISDAAGHFLPRFNSLEESIKKHPLITEHRETATVVNEPLQSLFFAAYISSYFLMFCKTPFSITGFLKHRLDLALPRISLSSYASGKKDSFSDVTNSELYDTLKRWRDMTCSETDLPIYMVANHASLLDISTFLPRNKKDLMLLSGFGKAKAEKYGDEILDIVNGYCSSNGLESNMSEIATSPKREKIKRSGKKGDDTKTISFNLFKTGKDIASISKERNLSVSTVEAHLSYFINEGQIIIDEVVKKEKQQKINEALAKHGPSSLKTLFENLPDGISYGEIRMVLAANKVQEKRGG